MEKLLIYWLDKTKKDRERLMRETRNLTPDEIACLEEQMNRCADWSRIKVSRAFSASRITRCTFSGDCHLGSNPELENSSFGETQIQDDAVVLGSGPIVRCYIGNGARIERCGSLRGDEENCFGTPLTVNAGSETGGRGTTLRPAASWDEICRAVLDREKAAEPAPPISFPVTVIADEAAITSVPLIRNLFAGAGCRVEAALQLTNSLLLSSPEAPVIIGPGVIIRGSILQPGAHADTQALIENSLLCESAGAERQVKISHSLIAPNNDPAEGEITSSLVGPYTGFHHQSLLIGVLWPNGFGNVAHGANVGSNHTGRLPDQELFAPEGLFFGLGSTIQYPADLRGAPWSLIASGVITLPQKVTFPFSLISRPDRSDPSLPPAWNQIYPGWVFLHNHYQLRRALEKTTARNKARYHSFSCPLITEESAERLADCLELLERIPPDKPWYTAKEIPGLGKNYVTREAVEEAKTAYRLALEWYTLDLLQREPTKSRPRCEKLCGLEGTGRAERTERLLEKEKVLWGKVLEARKKDDLRGVRIQGESYTTVHPPAAEDPFILREKSRVEKKCAALKATLKDLS